MAHQLNRRLKRVTCCVESCRKEINLQSYPDHLRSQHLGEDAKDRRVYGERKLNFFSQAHKRKKDDSPSPAGSKEEESVVGSEEEGSVVGISNEEND